MCITFSCLALSGGLAWVVTLITETSHHQRKMLHRARNGWLLPRKEAETTRRARGRTSPASVRLGAGVSIQREVFHAGILF